MSSRKSRRWSGGGPRRGRGRWPGTPGSPDRRSDRERAGLAADDGELIQDFVKPIVSPVRARARVDRGDEPRRKLVLAARTAMCGASGVTGSRHELVDHLGRSPERLHVDTAAIPGPVESAGEPLTRDSVERGPTGYTAQAMRSAPARAASRAAAKPSRSRRQKRPTEARCPFGERRDELVGPDACLECAGRIVEKHAAPRLAWGSFFAGSMSLPRLAGAGWGVSRRSVSNSRVAGDHRLAGPWAEVPDVVQLEIEPGRRLFRYRPRWLRIVACYPQCRWS